MPATALPQDPVTTVPPTGSTPARPGGPDPRRVGQVSEGLRKWRKLKSTLVAVLCLVCAVVVITPLALVFGYLVSRGAGALNWDFFTQLPGSPDEPGGGVVQAILGTFGIVGLASLVGIPTGVLGALYLTEYASPRIAGLVRFAADLLNGVPSIVWGIVAYALFVLPHARGGSIFSVGTYSALAGSAALAFIMIPLVLRTAEEVLLLVPGGYREAALALGIARWKINVHIILKTASKGIITGALLAVARAAGETAPLIFTTLGNSNLNWNPARPTAALPLQIYQYSQMPSPEANAKAWAAALVLLLLVLGLNLSVRFITRERSNRPGRGKPGAATVATTTAVTGGAAVAAQ